MSGAKLQAVLFDMDGTILAPEEHSSLFEFKARWGIPDDQLVVPNLPKLPRDAYHAFVDLESSLAEHSHLRPGVTVTLRVLRDRGLKTALVTNNCIESVQVVQAKHGIDFDLVLTRDDAPMKPEPDMLLRALEQLEVRPAHAVMVGDTSADVGAAENARVGHCYLLAAGWNEQFQGGHITRVESFAELQYLLLKRL